jgi:hypothetical protein
MRESTVCSFSPGLELHVDRFRQLYVRAMGGGGRGHEGAQLHEGLAEVAPRDEFQDGGGVGAVDHQAVEGDDGRVAQGVQNLSFIIRAEAGRRGGGLLHIYVQKTEGGATTM